MSPPGRLHRAQADGDRPIGRKPQAPLPRPTSATAVNPSDLSINQPRAHDHLGAVWVVSPPTESPRVPSTSGTSFHAALAPTSGAAVQRETPPKGSSH
jgi:hypothetical protein